MNKEIYILLDCIDDSESGGYLDFVAMSPSIEELKSYINTKAGSNLAIFPLNPEASTNWQDLKCIYAQVGSEWNR